LQEAAIEEAAQNALENPIAAATAAAIAGKDGASTTGGQENLLDVDFDGAAPASLQKENVAGTAVGGGAGGGLEDLMGVFGNEAGSGSGTNGLDGGGSSAGGAGDDLMNGLAGMSLAGGMTAPPPAASQLQGTNGAAPAGGKKTNEDLLGLF